MKYSSDLLKKLPAVQDKLPPIGRPVSARVTSLEDGRAVLCIEIAGMPFESVSTRVIENHFDGLNRFFAALAMDKGNRLSIHLTFNRRHVSFAQRYTFTSNFVQQLVDKYLDRGFRKRAFFENTFFMSLVLKLDDLEEGIVELEDLGETVMKQLVAYDPEYLTTFERNGMLFSQPYRFMGELINGVEEDIPVTDAPGYELIPNAWLHFGYDVLEIRGEAKSKFATCYDLKDFPNCGWGQLNPLLTLPAEFTLTQTFTCMGTYEAQKALESQANKLKSAGDKATHQIEELQTAQGYISSRELAFGDYHGALVVYGETAQKAIDNGTFVTARSLGECGVRWIKATLSAPMTYFSQIPGATRKPRPMPKSTRNLAAAFSMHNYSSGKRTGNPLGDGSAVMPLHTTAKGMFNFNNHASRLDQDNTGEKVAGHTLMLGATGVGKTTTQLTMLAFLERFDPKIFAMDLDRGMEMFIHVLGGVYFPLRAGEPTGLAPFGLPDTPKNREHCYDLVRACGRDTDGKISAEDEQFIKVAVDTVYRIEDRQQRRFSRLLETIPNTGDNCLAVRLYKWCHATEGRFAWALDNAPDSMIDVASQRRIGFDVTDFLKDNYEPTELEQQVQTMEQQYTTMTTQLNALTGNRGLGQILDNPSLRSYLPDQWQSIYDQTKSGQLSGISSAATQIESEEGMTASTPGQQRYNDTLAANKAMSMQAYQANISRLQNIKSLMQQSDATQDPAAKADLQNRLQSENAMIQNEQTRLNLMGQLQQAEEKLAVEQRHEQYKNSILGVSQ